jgi:hypothetical protein
MSLVEVSLAMSIVATVLMASSLAFTTSLSTVGRAERITDGAVYLETVMQNIAAQDFDALLAMNGNQFFDGQTLVASQFTVDLTVFTAQVDLLQIEGVLTDRQTNRALGQATTYRTRR